MDIISNYLLEIVVSTIALIVLIIVWIINRFYKGGGKQINLDSGALVMAVTVVAAIIIAVGRSEMLRENPLLTIIGALALISAASGISDVFITNKFRKDLEAVSARFGAQMKGLGNLRYYPTKEEAFEHLIEETLSAREKLMATRFSPGDISTEDDYWAAVKKRALDPSIFSIRIHCLAHSTSTAIDGVCRLISEFRGAKQFRLGITFHSNEFEMIIADEKEVIFCFHDLDMTIRNGFHAETVLPGSAGLVDNMGDTFRRIVEKCYLVIDFEKFVRTEDDAKKLQSHLRAIHKDYRNGKLPEPIHHSVMEDFLRKTVFN